MLISGVIDKYIERFTEHFEEVCDSLIDDLLKEQVTMLNSLEGAQTAAEEQPEDLG